jgi:hypothetical protein
MKKLFFIPVLLLSFFFNSRIVSAQSLSLDTIFGFPDTVVASQQVQVSIIMVKSGGAFFSGDLSIQMHSVNSVADIDTIFRDTSYSLSGNTFGDTISLTVDLNETNLDADENIVVVWPSSSSIPLEVDNDSLVFGVFLKNVGVAENAFKQSILLFPNPSHSILQLFFAYPEKVEQVRVLDILGKEILNFDKAIHSVNVEDLDVGIYFVEVKSRDGGVIVKKFFRD